MILIADSGSTKCDWLLHHDDQLVFKTSTVGLNPHILSVKQLQKVLKKNQQLQTFHDQIAHIYFFGAGCGTSKNQQLIKALLAACFINAEVLVQEDLMAAAWAVNKEPAVLCILGTGSNCAYFDGQKLSSKLPSLGYLLMDEGSGNSFGKRLLRSYYFGQMPKELATSFEKQFNLDPARVVHKLYSSKTPNRYLAKFARFAIDYQNHPYVAAQIKEEIQEFVKCHLMAYHEELKQTKLYFVGSVAYYLQDFIQEELKRHGYEVAAFIQRPMERIFSKLSDTHPSKLKVGSGTDLSQ